MELNIESLIAYIMSAIFAILTGWQTIRAQFHKISLKKVGGKIDIMPLIYEAIITTEKVMNGPSPGEDKFIHSQKKKKNAIELVAVECKQRGIPFEYAYVSNKIEESFILIKTMEEKLIQQLEAEKPKRVTKPKKPKEDV